MLVKCHLVPQSIQRFLTFALEILWSILRLAFASKMVDPLMRKAAVCSVPPDRSNIPFIILLDEADSGTPAPSQKRPSRQMAWDERETLFHLRHTSSTSHFLLQLRYSKIMHKTSHGRFSPITSMTKKWKRDSRKRIDPRFSGSYVH